MPVDFNKLIEDHLKRDSYPKKIGRYYPSEAGSCLRKSWYSYKHPQPTDPKKGKYFYMGQLIHDFVSEVLEAKNEHVELLGKEVPLKIEQPNFLVSGRLDDIFLVKADGRKFILEVKSTGSKLEWMEGPQDAHVMQIQLYMQAQEIKEGIILYLEKNSLECKWFMVKHDPAASEQVIARFAQLDSKLKSGELPGPEARLRPDWSWMCKNCEYFSMCSADTT
jgi:CRISPR/Cas system-associated exonuclease Cas4 (RecB family)